MILSAAGLIPGYWVTFLFIDTWGRKPIQFMGFAVLTVLFVIMGEYYLNLTATSIADKDFLLRLWVRQTRLHDFIRQRCVHVFVLLDEFLPELRAEYNNIHYPW